MYANTRLVSLQIKRSLLLTVMRTYRHLSMNSTIAIHIAWWYWLGTREHSSRSEAYNTRNNMLAIYILNLRTSLIIFYCVVGLYFKVQQAKMKLWINQPWTYHVRTNGRNPVQTHLLKAFLTYSQSLAQTLLLQTVLTN